MKRIEYRQYYYEGYTDEVLEVPDDCQIYCTDICGLYYNVYDNIWTKTYILLSAYNDAASSRRSSIGDVVDQVFDTVSYTCTVFKYVLLE